MYLYNQHGNKAVHAIDPSTGLTYCWVERNKNALNKLNYKSEEMPRNRRLCGNCEHKMCPVVYENTVQEVVKRMNKSAYKPERKTKLADDFYQSWEWAQLRFDVLVHYGAKCMLCGATHHDRTIVVDHVKPRKLYPELELEFSNMQVLCDLCNRGKSRREVDFRDLHFEEQVNNHMKSILNG